MKLTRNFVLPLAALFFGLLFVPQASAVGVANCPVEPKQGVAIASGDVFAGANCTLKTTGDVDGFVFTANSGDIWHFLVSGNNVGPGGIDVCLAVYNPSAVKIYSACANTDDGIYGFQTDQTLTATGTYTIDVTEAANGALNYGLSLERDYPTPTDGQAIQLTQSVVGTLSPGEDSPAYTFAVDSTGTYQASATIPNGSFGANNLCIGVYTPKGASAGSACTNTADGIFTVNVDFTPPENGTSMVLAYPSVGDGGGTVSYSVEVSCLAGVCTQPPPPPCTLKDAVSYASGTLTMNFTVGSTSATTWNAWLTSQNTIAPLSGFPISEPITNPPVPITKTASLSPAGTVGILSTLTTPTKGIFCSSYVQINTGTPSPVGKKP
jgi:hypothetical protein